MKEQETEDPIYVLPDDSDTGDDGKNHRKPSHRHHSPFGLWLKLMATPVEGWKEIKRSGCTPGQFSRGCFYPLLLGAALAIYAGIVYNPDNSIARLSCSALINFMSLLIGNFGTVAIADLILPTRLRNRINTDFGRIFVMMMVSTLCAAVCVWYLLPPLTPLLSFIPIYVIYLIARGVKYLRIPAEDNTKMTIVMSALIIGLPLLLRLMFINFIPE